MWDVKCTDIFATQCRRPKIFQTMIYIRSNNLSLKYKRFTLSGCEDIWIRKFEFVAKLNSFQGWMSWIVDRLQRVTKL